MRAAAKGGMRLLAETCEGVSLTTKKSEKVRLICEYLKSAPGDEAASGALFFTGRPFPRREERVLGVGGSLLSQLVAEMTGATEEQMGKAYRAHGDLGGMAEELFKGRAAGGALPLRDVAAAFDRLAAARGQAEKKAVLRGLFERTDGRELKYLIKIITGDLRIGAKENLVEEAIAAAFAEPLDAVRRANMLSGDIAQTAQLAAVHDLGAARMRLFAPLGFMLATPAETAEEIPLGESGVIYVEEKYDGIRAQVHKGGAGVKLFSRTLDELTEFPELNVALQSLPGEMILDGEILGWRDSRPLPFTQLQKRLGSKVRQMDLWATPQIPVKFIAFDLLYQDGELLLDTPLESRRARLGECCVLPGILFDVSRLTECRSTLEITETFRAALAAGHEGIVAKVGGSPYTPGRRGQFWFKLKEPMATLDVVVTAVEYGHGKRHGVLSDYTFAVREGKGLRNIGKAYTGLTDVEIRQYTDYFLQHIVEDQGFRKMVEPEVVIEVAFNNIQQSKRHDSGYALRFPRIVRLRPDKKVTDIDTLERVAELYANQGHPGGDSDG